MINEKHVNSYCRENISLIQNYDKAISDDTNMWHCHHRLGTVIPKKNLLEMDLYYNRPATELIFLLEKNHRLLHNKGKYISEETRKKLSEKLKGENNPRYGKHLSEETKKKISEAAKRRPPMSDETRKKQSESHKGKQPWNKGLTTSEETRKKQSESHKGKLPWNKGKTMSNETKQKNREAHQGKHRVYDNNGKFHYEF